MKTHSAMWLRDSKQQRDSWTSTVSTQPSFPGQLSQEGAAVQETANSGKTRKHRVNTAFILGPAHPGAAGWETAKSGETRKYRVNTDFVRGPALPRADVGETAKSRETRKYKVNTAFIHRPAPTRAAVQGTAKWPAKVKSSSPLTFARELQRQ